MGNKHKGKSKRSRSVLVRRQQRRQRHSTPPPLSSAASPAPASGARPHSLPRVEIRAERSEDAQAGARVSAQAQPLAEEAHMELAEHVAQEHEVTEHAEAGTDRSERSKGRRKRPTKLVIVHDGEIAPAAAPEAPLPETPREPAPELAARADHEAGAAPLSEETQPVAARVVRRTKTLADVTMPARAAEQAGRAEASGGIGGQTPAESPRVTTGQIAAVRARSRLSSATRPIPSVGLLAPSGERGASPEQEPSGQSEDTLGGLVASRFLAAVRRGDPRLMLRAALAHVVAGLAAGAVAGALLVAGSEVGYWLLVLGGIALLSGVTAYVVPQWQRTTRPAAIVLAVTHLAALGWACALLGPQVGLMLLVPAAAWLALRLGGHWAALLCAVGSLVVYLAFVVATAAGAYVPELTLSAAAATILDAVAALVGVGLLLAGLLRTADARERSDAAARARLYELRLLRAELARVREQTERDSFVMEQALTGALRGRGIDPVFAEGALSPVAERVHAVAERMATLQKDREDRLRLEAALRTLIRAVERGWLGLPWTWPDTSGTMLDDLVALLRTPRPHEQRGARRGDELPPFVILPNAESPSRPSGTHPSASSSHGSTPPPGHGWDDLLSR